MKNRNLFLIALLFISFNASAQGDKGKIKCSAAIEGSKFYPVDKIIKTDNGYAALYEDLTYRQLDKSMNVFGAPAEIDIKKQDKSMEYEGSIYYNDQLILLRSKKNKETKINVLFAQAIDKKTLKFIGEKVKVGEIKYDKKEKEVAFHYAISADNSKLLIYFEKNEPGKIGLHVVDANLMTQWEKQIELPKSKFYSAENYKVDKNGDVYLSVVEFTEKGIKKVYDDKKKSKEYKYHIFSYNNERPAPLDYTIAFEDTFLTDLQYQVAEDGDLICTGFYARRGVFDIKGVFHLRVDVDSKNIAYVNLKEFASGEVSEKWSISAAKNTGEGKKDVDMKHYILRDLMTQKDGNIFFVAEQYEQLEESVATSNANGTSITKIIPHHYYGDVITASIDTAGNVRWISTIPKRQFAVDADGYYSSYYAAARGKNLYVIFNDYAKNTADKKGSNVEIVEYNSGAGNQGICTIVEVKENGEYKREQLFKTEEQKAMASPKVSYQMEDGQVILFSKNKKTEKFCRVDL